MTPQSRMCCPLAVSVFLILAPVTAYAQISLSGAMQFSTDSNGNATSQRWNTLGAPADNFGIWDLWVASDPSATMPVNGPSDAQAAINIPLQAGQSYTYYIFSQPNGGYSFDALNLFFNGNNTTPGISVFGAIDSSSFRPNSGSTWTLAGASVPGSGSSFYSANGMTVVLSAYNWNNPATQPGDVCQSYTFTAAPGNVLSYYGSFSMQVWPAATLSVNQTGGPPGTLFTTAGSGFSPGETVTIYANHTSGSPVGTAVADVSGGFTFTTIVPQLEYGSIDIYAVGQASGKLGAATFFVSARIVTMPRAGVPGDMITARELGFGAGETVEIYWLQPLQLLGTTVADGRGTGSLDITIPANAPHGPNGLRGVGTTTGAVGFGRIEVK